MNKKTYEYYLGFMDTENMQYVVYSYESLFYAYEAIIDLKLQPGSYILIKGELLLGRT